MTKNTPALVGLLYISCPHSTHAHSAEADVTTASRQQSTATAIDGQRVGYWLLVLQVR